MSVAAESRDYGGCKRTSHPDNFISSSLCLSVCASALSCMGITPLLFTKVGHFPRNVPFLPIKLLEINISSNGCSMFH